MPQASALSLPPPGIPPPRSEPGVSGCPPDSSYWAGGWAVLRTFRRPVPPRTSRIPPPASCLPVPRFQGSRVPAAGGASLRRASGSERDEGRAGRVKKSGGGAPRIPGPSHPTARSPSRCQLPLGVPALSCYHPPAMSGQNARLHPLARLARRPSRATSINQIAPFLNLQPDLFSQTNGLSKRRPPAPPDQAPAPAPPTPPVPP